VFYLVIIRLEDFAHDSTSNLKGSSTRASVSGEVKNPVIFHTAAEARKVSLQAWSNVDIELDNFTFISIPNRLEFKTLLEAVAHTTNKEHLLFIIVLDVITSVA